MPDEVKNALMARELKGKDDSETERLRRKYVRDLLDAKGATRDINLPANLSERDLKHIEATRAIGNAITSSRVKKAQEREDYNTEFYARYGAGLPPVPARKQDINLPVEKRSREDEREDLKDKLDAQERNQATRSRAAKGWR